MVKYIFFLLFSLTTILTFGDTEGNIAYFNFDNNMEDSVSGNFNGTAYGDLTYVTGALNNGVFFDNEDHVDSEYKSDYISLPNISLNEFSLSIWIKFNKNSHYKEHDAAFYSIGSEDTDGTFFAISVDGNNRLFASLYCNDHNKIKVFQTDDLSITDGQWHHIAVIVSKTSITLYEDGIEGNSVNTGFDIELLNQPQFFGYHQWENGTKGSSRINGSIDEVKIFPKVITESDVINLFHLTTSGLVSHYSFEGDLENSENGNSSGTLHGNTSYITGKKGLGLKFNTVEHTSTEFLGDYVNFPNISISEFTVMFWVRYRDNASNISPSAIYTLGSKDSGNTFFGTLVDNNKKLNAYFYHDNHDNLSFDKYIDISDENWHHIAVTVSKENMKIYDNSQLIDERTTGFTIIIKSQPQYLGLLAWNNGGSKASRLIGDVDELRVYNYELEQTEINFIYDDEKNGYTNTSYLPHFDISQFWETKLTLTNFSVEKQEFLINAYSKEGAKVSEIESSLEAGALLSLKIRDLFPLINEETGWLEIKTYSKLLKGLANYKFLTTESETSLPIISEIGTNYLFPLMENMEFRNSGIAFTNTESIDTTLTLSLIDETGMTIGSTVIELPSLSKKAIMLKDLFGNFENQKISLKIKSSLTNICCYGLTFINNNSAIVAVPGILNN